VIVIVQNEGDTDKAIKIKVGGQVIEPLLKADSFNTLVIAAK